MDTILFNCREEFYNFKDFCDAAIHGDLARAEALFQKQSRCLFSAESVKWEDMVVFLTSMNRSLYNYILYTMDISLYQCCFENACRIRHCRTQEEFQELAHSTVDSYLKYMEGKPHNNGYVLKAQDYITRNLDKPLNLEEVASHIFISKAYLSELFPAYTGKSFSAYVNDCRMKLAQELLLSTGLSIQAVGQSCGFVSPAYFSTAFAKQVGLSPRQFRNAKLKSA